MVENTEGPEKFICFKLNKVRRKIHRYYEGKLASFNITPVQFYVLSALWDKEEVRFKDLSRTLDMDGATLTGILDRLEKRGFIKRKGDPDDRRSVLVSLTRKSKEIKPQMLDIAQNLDKEFRDKVSPEKFQMLLKILDEL
ncbi:MAG: MarR family transcriptional regulator [Methanobacterium sp.]